ncbi:YafY family protein [Pseudomonas sp. R5(2019)]|uniref:helix-turn-helix transcriptional regulator n=1 Tax=Pseudomonas sp. R5(2019) TaxID=2697566 RepID=UPI001411DE06|nr:WYL domain-containing protein [Pseudomonas sp. R5(2019)]NBA98258.1 WYL domain-containing protein [Pseudomonas sp. R5(2019)]
MPSAKAHTTLSRQWELLRQLPNRSPGLTTSELVNRLLDAGFTISKRSIERDLNELSLIFPILRNDRSIPYGWHWRPGACVDLQGISVTEALSLALVEDAIRPLLPASMLKVLDARFAHARQKLEHMAGQNKAARWLDKVASVRPDINLQAPEVPDNILETVQEALLQERQLRCRYYSAHADKTSELTLNPLALVQRGTISYLIATAQSYADVRQFAVHRLRDASVLPSTVIGLDTFDLHEYLNSDALQFGTREKIALKAWVSDSLARFIRETPLSSDMTLTPLEDGHCLQATVSNSRQLRWWLLSQGDGLIVEAPESLREQIAQTLESAAAQYRP